MASPLCPLCGREEGVHEESSGLCCWASHPAAEQGDKAECLAIALASALRERDEARAERDALVVRYEKLSKEAQHAVAKLGKAFADEELNTRAYCEVKAERDAAREALRGMRALFQRHHGSVIYSWAVDGGPDLRAQLDEAERVLAALPPSGGQP